MKTQEFIDVIAPDGTRPVPVSELALFAKTSPAAALSNWLEQHSDDGGVAVFPLREQYKVEFGFEYGAIRKAISDMVEIGSIKLVNTDVPGQRHRITIQVRRLKIIHRRTVMVEEQRVSGRVGDDETTRKDSDPDSECPIISHIVKLDTDRGPPPSVEKQGFSIALYNIWKNLTRRDVNEVGLVNFSPFVLLDQCWRAPELDIAIAMYEVEDFIPATGGAILQVISAFRARFKHSLGKGYLDPKRPGYKLKPEEVMKLRAILEDPMNVRPADIRPSTETGHKADDIELLCKQLAGGVSVERGLVPNTVLVKFDRAFVRLSYPGDHVKLAEGFCLKRHRYGFWWLGLVHVEKQGALKLDGVEA